MVAAAHPASDAGLDSDLGSYINGGTVIALGSAMDWAESDSDQVTMNLQFAAYQDSTNAIVVTTEDGTEIFSYNPSTDTVVGKNARRYMGAVISCANFKQGETYQVYVGGTQMMYTGTDVMMRPGGFGGQRPDGGQPPELPEGETMPEGWTPGEKGERPEGFGGQEPPEGFEGQMPTWPEGEVPTMPDGEAPAKPEGDRGDRGEMPGGFGGGQPAGEGNSRFYMQDMVNFFSGLTEVSK